MRLLGSGRDSILALCAVAFASLLSSAPALSKPQPAAKQSVVQPTAPPKNPQEYCLDNNFIAKNMLRTGENADQLSDADKTKRVNTTNLDQLSLPQFSGNGSIVIDSLLLPAGGNVDIGITKPFNAATLYYAYIYFSESKVIEIKSARARAAAADDPLVKKNKLTSSSTIINLGIPDIDQTVAWQRARLFVFGCKNSNPDGVLQSDVRISPSWYSAIAAWLSVLAVYLVAAFALGTGSLGQRLARLLDPIQFTAGMDGKASMGKLQILFFSLIVFGLLLYLLLRTGVLTEISVTVLSLLGIAGFGSTLAKGADLQRTTLTPENRAFLIRKEWLNPARTTNIAAASWRELFMTDGEFDVYRYQSFIFSVAVGGALLIGGITQLSSFEIPQTLLGILGLSQAVYIGGKLVTPTTMGDLNKSLNDLRTAETTFQDSAKAANGGVVPQAFTASIQTATQANYDAYKRLATNVRTLFTAETGIAVQPEKLEPSVF